MKFSYKEFVVHMIIFASYQQTPEDANPTISWWVHIVLHLHILWAIVQL